MIFKINGFCESILVQQIFCVGRENICWTVINDVRLSNEKLKLILRDAWDGEMRRKKVPGKPLQIFKFLTFDSSFTFVNCRLTINLTSLLAQLTLVFTYLHSQIDPKHIKKLIMEI